MGKKLSYEKGLENMLAVDSFTNWERIIEAHVSVECKGKRIFYFRNVTIHISKQNGYYNVNIPWEDIGKRDFRDLGLYGYYSTGFNEMCYSEEGEFLRIKSSDSDKEVVFDKV